MGEINFLASFPDIQSAIKVGSDGMRIMLDIPESEMAQAIKLVAMRGKVLEITIVENDTNRIAVKCQLLLLGQIDRVTLL